MTEFQHYPNKEELKEVIERELKEGNGVTCFLIGEDNIHKEEMVSLLKELGYKVKQMESCCPSDALYEIRR